MSNADRVDAYLSRKNSKSSNATSTTTKTSNADRVDAYLHKRNEEAFSKMRLHNVNGDFRKTGNYKDYGYKTQEAYDADVKKYNWASANQGLTYDEVKKRRQTATGDELNYLNQYGTLVGYNDIKDYDAEIADLTTSGVDWNKLKQKGVEFALGSELTRNLGINVDDSTYRDQLEAKANQMRLNNPLVDYQDIINAEDFAELSANAPVENKDKYGYAKQIAAETLLGRNLAKKLGFDYGSAWDDTLKSKMTDEEIAVYNYIANKQAQEGDSYSGVTADEYMDNIATSLGKRVTDDYTAQAKEFSDSNGNVGSEILAKTLLGWNGAALLDDKAKNDLALTTERIAMQPLALASEAMNLGDTLTTGEYNPYGQYAMLYNVGEANQNIVSQDIADATPNANVLGVNVPSFLYNTGLSTADSAIGAAMFGPAYSFLMGTGAFQSEAKKIIDAGGSQEDVWMKAGAAGITEVVTEYYSLEKLENLVKNKDIDSVGKVLLSTLRQAGYEGSEEVAADVINHLVDEAYNGGLSETSQKIEEYKRLGYSDSEATKMAYKDFAIQVGESFVGGALSGGAMGGAVATNNYISNANAGANLRANNNLQAIDEAAQNLDRESDAFKNYERITKGSNDISKARDAEISSAYNQINRQLNKQEVENLLTMRGMDYEEAKIASSAVAELMSTNSTEGMSKAEIEALSDDRVVNLVNGILDGRISLQRSDKLGRARQMRTVFQDASSIEQTEDGYVIHNQDGTTETVASDAVSTTEADIMGYVSKYNEEAQNIFLENYRYSGNIGIYDAAFNTVYKMGIDGERLGKNEGRVFGDILGDRNVLNIYKAGMKSVNQRAEASAIAIENALEGFKEENFKSGTFKSNLEFKRLNKKKQNLYRMAQGFSALGLNIEVVDDNSDDASNGSFNADTNTITINLSARHSARDVKGERQRYVVNTFAHELTHYLEYNANDAYQVLKNLVKEGLQNKFEDSASIWDNQFSYEYYNAKERIKKDAKKNNKQLSDEEIYEKASAIAESEVVARACENILNNNQQMIDILSQSDVSTLKTIRTAIAKFLEKFRSMVQKLMGGFESQMKEAQAVKEIDGLLEKMQKAWADAFTQAIGKAQITDKMEESAGIRVDSDTGTIVSDLNSEKRSLAEEWQNMKHKVNGKNVNYESYEECIDDVARTIANKSHQDYEKVKEWIKAEESISAMIMREEYAEFLDYEADDRFQPIKKNSDYPQGTFDLSNLCRKREIFTKMFDALQRRNAKVLFDADDLATIRQVLAEEHYEVACALCYVEDRRQKMGEIAQAFIGYYQDALKSKDKLIFKINSEGESVALKPSKDQRDKYHLPDAQYKATDKYIPTQYDLVTYEGFKALQENHPTIAYAFERYNNSRGMASARVIEGHAEYARQVLGYTVNQIAKINSLGGLRVFSFSDFQAMHLIDVVQIINDCAKMGIKMQAYTKVPEFAELVRNTRMKINRSLIPANVGSKNAYARVIENGKVKYVKVKPYKNGIAKYKGKDVLAYDIVEGIDITSKHFLDETDSANVGNILVGCNDDQIKIAMTDPFIDYIIPFHTGQRLSVLHTKGIGTWDNYKDIQEDRKIGSEEAETNGKKKKKTKGVNIYDLIKNGNVTNKYEFFDAFIKAANGKDLIPRFDKFIDKDEKGNYVYTEGYWKMLLDFKMFDAEGNILPQETVVPVHFEEEGHLDVLVKEIFDKDVAREKDMRFDKEIDQKIKDALKEKHGVLNSAKRSNGTYEKKAIEHFGTTENFNVAGYILNDGQMLDFSGAHWLEGYDDAYIRNWKSKNDIRQVDHEDIYEVMEKSGDNRKQFMDRGNIRISPEAPGINISTKAEPTAAQYARIKEFVNSIKDGNRFYLDIEDTKPNKVTYNGKISADRVVNDIRTFFETGVMPKGSEGSLSEYLYSTKRDSKGNNLTVAQEEFFKDSKARDSKGNLLVLYHGTTDGGFNTFNNADGIGYWFTDSVYVASTYSDAYATSIYAPSNSLQDDIDYDDIDYDDFDYDDFDDVNPNVNYKCYLNITNPYIIDAKGRAWNDLPSNNSKSLKMIVDVSNTGFKIKFDGKTKSIGLSSWDEFEGYMKSLGFDDDRIAHMYDVLGNVEFGQSHTFDIYSKEGKFSNFTTRDYEKYAYDNGYDGLIVNNVIDHGFAADESDKNDVSNVYVAFNPNQIKSVNNQNPTSNPDIRYSSKRDSEGNVLTDKQTEFFKNSKARDKNGNLMVMYHGTPNGSFTEFSLYDSSMYNDNAVAFWFTPNRNVAERFSQYSEGASNNSYMFNTYLNITNPLIIDAKGSAWNKIAIPENLKGRGISTYYDYATNSTKERKSDRTDAYAKWAKENGYDGVIIKNVIEADSNNGMLTDTYAVFDSNQIKDVNNTNPTSNDDIRYSTKRGYHAGDLGKSESLAQQGYGRDTGHFGTGTYFVSDPKAIEGYNSRNGEKAPIETVDFSKYNLYKVSTDRQGYRLHDFLRFVDGYYNINDYEIRNEEDWERRKDDLDYAISENSISKEDAFKEALNLFGEYEVGRRVNENSDVPENMWINYQDGEFYMIDQSDNYKDVPITYEQAIDYIRMDDLVYSLISDNRYAPKFVDRIERFAEFISEYSDELFGLSEEEVYDMLDDISKEIKNLNTNGKTDDSAATRFMKRLGYEGIDVGGTGLDNTAYGSVIYDLKGEDLARKQEIGTARFSEKRTVEQKLQAENEKLKADVKNLRDLVKLQGKETHGYIPSKSTIEAAAKSILNGSKSTYNRANLEKELAAVWTKFAKGASINSLYDDIKAMADNVANDIRDQVEVDKTYKRMLNDIRKTHVSFTDRQLQYAKDRYGSPSKNYNDYRNAFMGKVILDKNAEALDTMWQRWMQVYPDVFEEMSEEDMVDGLLDAYANIKDAAQYVVDLDYEYASNEIAQTITEKLWNISAYQTVADKYADKIKQIRAEHREEMKELRDSRNSERAKAKSKDAIVKIKADRDAKINAINEMYKQRKTSEREKNAKNKLISHIEKNCIKLTNWINGRDKNHHVVVELLEPVQALLDSLDFASNRMLGITPNGQESFGANKGKPTRRDVSIIKAMEKMRRAVEDSLKAQEDVATTFAFPEDMLDTLDEIKDYMERIQEQVADDAKSNNLMYQNALIVRMLDIPRLQMVDEVVSIMTGVVTQADKLVASRNAHSVDYIAQKIMKDADARNARFKAGNRFVDGIDTFLNSDNITPYYFFKHLGEGGMDIFTEIMDGWDAYAFKNKAINDFIDSIWDEFKDESYTKWRDDIQDIEIEEMPTEEEAANGAVAKTITLHMNIPQIMSFYCLNKREQARSHIYQKGIKIANIEGRNSSGVQVATITQDAADKIIAVLNKPEYKNAKIVADRLQKFMSEECAKWGNEITYKRFGIMGFTEENYFPIQVDNNAINKEPKEGDAASIYRLLNMSFTKRLTENASNKLVISDIFDVFTNHASDMAKYNTLALPTLDLIKVLNYKEVSRTEGSQREEVGTRQSLERAFDTRSIKYIYRFLEDLNGSQVKEDGMILKTLLRNAKIAAVGANFQVALLQPMSYIRAAYNLEPAYLARALRRRPQIHKVKEECGVSCWKDQGYYDVNTNNGLVHKIKRDNGVIEKIREGSMIGAQHLDDVTWGYLYNACEEWANDNVSYSHDSKEYRQAVNDKFRELAYETQVFDSTVSRSQAMRNKGYGWQIATSFGSEPTLGLNMLYDAVNGFATDIRKGATTGQALRNNRNKMLRAFTVFATGAILESALRAAIAKLRKPDDDEEYWRLLLQHLIDELNPLTKVPIIKDFISFLEGYSVSRLEYGGLDNAAQAIRGFAKSFSNGEPPTWKSVSKMFQAFSQLAGIPITGVMRDGLTIWNNIVKLLGYDSLIVKM